MTSPPAVAVAGVSHFLGQGRFRAQVLFNVSMTVRAGELLVLSGPSGSGKTTLLTLLGGLRHAEGGTLRVLGEELRGASERTRIRVRRQLLPHIVRRVKELFQVESAAIMLLDASGAELHFPHVDDQDPIVAERLRNLRVPRDAGFAGWVVSHAEPILVTDAAADSRFYSGVDEALGRTTRDLACAPLRTRRGIVGVVEVINKRGGWLTTNDLELLEALSGTIAISIENARLLAEVRAREAVLQREVTSLRRVAAEKHEFQEIISASPAMQEVLHLLQSACDTPVTVLIEGETGTGKELAARVLHYNGARRARAFVAVNCAALNDNLLESELFGHRRGAFTGALADKKGLFEVAHEGTIFLDEIGDTSPAFQAKLLRVLQEGEFLAVGDTQPRRASVRVIAATNRDLAQEVRAGRFREDLYYRIGTFPVRLPPLRERRDDIPMLADRLLQRAAARLKRPIEGIEAPALALLEAYHWPGNVRELEGELERAVTLTPRGGWIGTTRLSAKVRPGAASASPDTADAGLSLWEALRRFEQEYLRRALLRHGGNVSQTARGLGISRIVLQRKMKALGLRDDGPTPA